jgi:hypothetical protein
MELTVKERIVLLNMVPKEGDFKTLKQIRKFREDLGFNEDENKLLDFKPGAEGTITWTEPEADKGIVYKKDIHIVDSVMELIADALVQADKGKTLNNDTFDLYERFVINAKDQVE